MVLQDRVWKHDEIGITPIDWDRSARSNLVMEQSVFSPLKSEEPLSLATDIHGFSPVKEKSVAEEEVMKCLE